MNADMNKKLLLLIFSYHPEIYGVVVFVRFHERMC